MPDPAPKGWADSARAFRSRKSARMAVRRFLKYLPCQGAGAILSKPDGDGWPQMTLSASAMYFSRLSTL